MKKTLITLIISVSCHLLYSQQHLDTNNVILNAKLLLMVSEGLKSPNYIHSFIEYKPKYRFMESKGFHQIVFFEINAEPYIDSLRREFDGVNFISPVYFGNYNYSFIFAYSKLENRIYKINGFIENDFLRLFEYMKKSPFYEKEVFLSEKAFTENFYIEDINLSCYYNFYVKNKTKGGLCFKSPYIYGGSMW